MAEGTVVGRGLGARDPFSEKEKKWLRQLKIITYVFKTRIFQQQGSRMKISELVMDTWPSMPTIWNITGTELQVYQVTAKAEKERQCVS